MNPRSLDPLADDFERLRLLPPPQRREALVALPLAAADRELLARLLEADADTEDPLTRVLGAGAARVGLAQGQRLGPYQLVRELGAGGMGTVFLAERVEGGFAQQLAIKILRGFPTADGLRRLRQERQILAALDHPNIARLLDGGETADGQPWLALEFVDGPPLFDHAARNAPTLTARLALFDAMLDAVAHAHRHLVIHRDLKPGNVLVTGTGQVKLLDFGIARLLTLEEQADTGTSTRIYSPGYASPEQIAGRAVTTASDIYSTGVLLRELLTARRADGAPIGQLESLPLDADLAGIVAKATDFEPARRYASAGEFRDDLDRYRQRRPVRAAAMTRRYRARKFVARHRLGVALGVMAACVLALFVWRLEHERIRALAAEKSAQRALAAAGHDAARAHAALGFLTDALNAAGPGSAHSRTVSVRDLLDAARTRLQARGLDPSVAQPLQRLLANLYSDLGERRIATGLFEQGLHGAQPHDRIEAMALARDFDRYAGLLAANGQLERAGTVAKQAADWRQRYAPDDADERARSLNAEAIVRHFAGDDTGAIALMRRALERPPGAVPLAPPLMIEVSQSLSGLLADSGDCDAAVKAADEGLAQAAILPADAPERIPLLNAKAEALTTCGQPAAAEAIIHAAIASQERVIGSGGVRMSLLLNSLAIALNDLGRYREAVAALSRSGELGTALGEGEAGAAITLGNRAAILENVGDYPQALALSAKARELLDAGQVSADSIVRRRLARNEARTLALAGHADEAIAMLARLRSAAGRLDGIDSFEYAMVTWQLALAERRGGRIKAAGIDLEEADRRFSALVPANHPIHASALRFRATLAMMGGDAVAAATKLLAAIKLLQAGSPLPIDLAIARSELASVRLAQGRRTEARALLEESLPVLRDAVLPQEASRAAAERTAAKLGIRDVPPVKS